MTLTLEMFKGHLFLMLNFIPKSEYVGGFRSISTYSLIYFSGNNGNNFTAEAPPV